MKKKFILGIGIITIIILSGCISIPKNQISEKKPEIEITPNFYDFGDIPYKKTEHVFFIKNKGTGLLEITGVSTSCGCTKGTINKKLIKAGETAELRVSIDPNLMEEGIEGKIERIVYVKSNDIKKPEIEIELKANIVR